MQDDITSSLSEIRHKSNADLISRLLDIQKHVTLGKKSIQWATNLRCLYWVRPSRKSHRTAGDRQDIRLAKTLRRNRIIIRQPRESYIAVSCPWRLPEDESPARGRYTILSAGVGEDTPSSVQDVVLDRVINFAARHRVYSFWIDRDCIDQTDSLQNTEKEMAIQSMDLVYGHSQYPLGLLFLRLDSEEQLYLLLGILVRKFITVPCDHQHPMLKQRVSRGKASKVLGLLHLITSDLWWDRAWIFQEDYRASTKMTLLIRTSIPRPHIPYKFGNTPGELEVNSANFREAATLFCLAYRRKLNNIEEEDSITCDRVLARAKRYQILHKYNKMSEGMSPTIFSDIGDRGISVPSDLLAIAANCCDYSIRLDTQNLNAAGCSLSLSILALYFLNGEIIKNGKMYKANLSGNIFKFLKGQSLAFNPPVEEKELTFIKHCRFTNVRLSREGIITSGCLWKVCKKIHTRYFTTQFKQDWRVYPKGLSGYQRSRLSQLAKEIGQMGYGDLSKDLGDYLYEDAQSSKSVYPSKQYKDFMAEKIVQAMGKGRPIYLGRLSGSGLYRGIFIHKQYRKQKLNESHAFTAWSCAQGLVDGKPTERNMDKFVSLEVEVDGFTSDGVPRLTTKRWMNGLCFFNRQSQRKVVFDWPACLRK
jgi:hypothetical protein